MDLQSVHSESDPDDDHIRYEINNDPSSARMTDRSGHRGGGDAPKTPVVQTEEPHAGRKRRTTRRKASREPDSEVNHRRTSSGRREEASESESDPEYHDSIRGDESDVEHDAKASWEPDDYRDVPATEEGRERRRGPRQINVEGSASRRPTADGKTAAAATAQSFFSYPVFIVVKNLNRLAIHRL